MLVDHEGSRRASQSVFQIRPVDARLDAPVNSVVRLDNNESPYGPPPSALEAALHTLKSEAHRYPETTHVALKSTLARKLGCTREMLSIANGSSELIDLIHAAFVRRGERVGSFAASFIYYRMSAEARGVFYAECPGLEHFKMCSENFLSVLPAEARIAWVATPNNPSGTMLGPEELERLALALGRRGQLMVLDQAYHEFAPESARVDTTAFVSRHPNVIALRTFSKAYGMASLRVGYAVARPELISAIERMRQPYNISPFALSAAEAAVKDESHVEAAVRKISHERARLCQRLQALGFETQDTAANFILLKVASADKLAARLKERGVMVKSLSSYGLEQLVRISIGRPEDHDTLVRELAATSLHLKAS